MTVQPIRLFGDPVLRTPAEPVVDFDKELRRLVADLVDTMRDEEGAGLAAPQIGVGLRVFAFDVDDVVGHLINPVLHFPDAEEQDGPEGCLSIPDLTANVRRATRIVVEHAEGTVESHGFEARCVLHEIDHLDGLLFLDRVESLVDDVFRRRVYADSGPQETR